MLCFVSKFKGTVCVRKKPRRRGVDIGFCLLGNSPSNLNMYRREIHVNSGNLRQFINKLALTASSISPAISVFNFTQIYPRHPSPSLLQGERKENLFIVCNENLLFCINYLIFSTVRLAFPSQPKAKLNIRLKNLLQQQILPSYNHKNCISRSSPSPGRNGKPATFVNCTLWSGEKCNSERNL